MSVPLVPANLVTAQPKLAKKSYELPHRMHRVAMAPGIDNLGSIA
jgi:hypothetical protein